MLHDLLGISADLLREFKKNPSAGLGSTNTHYKHKRKKDEESTSLKFDKFVSERIKKLITDTNPSTGAFSGKGIPELVKIHIDHKYVLRVDIKNYFESIQFKYVKKSVSTIKDFTDGIDLIESLYFGDGGLRRGLKASPAISEVIGLQIDNLVKQAIHTLGDEAQFQYSRFYDDLIISADNKKALTVLREMIEEMLNTKLNLEINSKKSKIVPTSGSNLLGVRIHNKEEVAPKRLRNKLRAMQHDFYRNQPDPGDLEELYQHRYLASRILGVLRYNHSLATPTKKKEYGELIVEYLDIIDELTIQIDEFDDNLDEVDSY